MNTRHISPAEQTRMSYPASRDWGNLPSRLMEEMNRIFDRFGVLPSSEMGTTGQFIPRVEIVEDEKSFHVDAELPGVDQSNIDLTLAKDSLTIKGTKENFEHRKMEDIACTERAYGEFSRVIPLPEDVDIDKVDAKYLNGVLCINLPKIEGAKSVKKIPIRNAEITSH